MKTLDEIREAMDEELIQEYFGFDCKNLKGDGYEDDDLE